MSDETAFDFWSTFDEFTLTPQEIVEYIGSAGSATIDAAGEARSDVIDGLSVAGEAASNAVAGGLAAWVAANTAALATLAAAGGLAYYTRDSWYPAVRKMLV